MTRPPLFAFGDRVKLTDRYATVLSKARGNPRNWVGRRGSVVYCNRDHVSIVWDGRKSVDNVPHKGVEMVREEVA